jgi:hypothetical protein
MRRYDQKHQMLLPDSVNHLIRDVLFNPDLINLLWFVLYCVNRLLFEKHFQCSYLNSKGQEAQAYCESLQCPSKWGPRGPLAPGTGDPGPLENGQEIPAGGPRPGATRAPLGARCRAS